MKTNPAPPFAVFSSGAALQECILQEGGPGALVLVPHRRLARQVWHRQRLAQVAEGRQGWEPLPLTTLPDWWGELFRQVWPPLAVASSLVRLVLWRRALAAAPPPTELGSPLRLARALDEAHELLRRHLLPPNPGAPPESPLVAWRREATGVYSRLLREEGWLTPAEIPGYLLNALEEGRLRLPARLLVVGLEHPAPAEEAWLTALARRLPVTRLALRGEPGHIREALEFPDQEEETAWVAARLLACREEGLPLSSLAVTSPDLDRYVPRLQEMLREILGPAAGPDGGAFNVSQGPTLGDQPLWAAALLPLTFLARGERREDLLALLLSPYYGRFRPDQGHLAAWDRVFREKRVAQGWEHLRQAAAAAGGAPEVLVELDLLYSPPIHLRPGGREWLAWLTQAWERLGFPGDLGEEEQEVYGRLNGLLQEFAQVLGHISFTPAELLEWLEQAAADLSLPGPGREDAGVQVVGWLEMRGLAFARVFALGMNSRALPGPLRPLPLLSREERRLVLGGTQESQDLFAREMYQSLLSLAPHLTFTRPVQEDLEPLVATPFYEGKWEKAGMPFLSRPDRAWVRSPAVQAACAHPAGGEPPGVLRGPWTGEIPGELRVTRLGTAMACLTRFILEELLDIRELPDLATGIDPRERGSRLHEVLARFVKAADFRLPPEGEDLALLQQVARQVMAPDLNDPDWQAEWHRWFGDEDTPGLLPAWLARERERAAEGWRWLAVEADFKGLSRPGWPFTLRGRLDRVDHHPERREVMVWDYKSGDIPSPTKVFVQQEEYQLPAYLLAVREGLVEPDWAAAAALAAGFIGLKSPRANHLQHQDFPHHRDNWPEVLAAWEEEVRRLAEQLKEGDITPQPRPAPTDNNQGACSFCPYPLLCSYRTAPAEEEEEA